MEKLRFRKSHDESKDFPYMAMMCPGIGIALGICIGAALKQIGWGIAIGAIVGGLFLAIGFVFSHMKKSQ